MPSVSAALLFACLFVVAVADAPDAAAADADAAFQSTSAMLTTDL